MMKPISTDQIVESLSADAQDLMVREAFVRVRRSQLLAELEKKRAEEAGREGTRPAFLMFRKDAKEEFKAAGERIRNEIVALERALGNCDLILKKCDRILVGEVGRHLEAQSDALRKSREAQGLAHEWRESANLYRSCLKRFIMTLGIARNQMSAGYDRKAGKFAAGTMEAFALAVTAAKSLATEASIPNKLAKRQRELLGLDPTPETLPDESFGFPYLPGSGLPKEVSDLTTGSLEAAATRISALIDRCEQLHADGVSKVIERTNQIEAGQQAVRARQVAAPLSEIRAMADGMVDEARMAEVLVEMEARFVTLTG